MKLFLLASTATAPASPRRPAPGRRCRSLLVRRARGRRHVRCTSVAAADPRLLTFHGAVVFAVSAAIAVRSTANELARVVGARASAGTASNLRLWVTMVGYVLVGVRALTVLHVPIEKLLLSGAITAVVIGIAAQQALANLFAGLVLLTSRPFEIGSWILLRSGALGGEYHGRVVGIGLTYTEINTEEGPFSLPNAGVLAAATGPRSPEDTSTTRPDVAWPVPRAGSRATLGEGAPFASAYRFGPAMTHAHSTLFRKDSMPSSTQCAAMRRPNSGHGTCWARSSGWYIVCSTAASMRAPDSCRDWLWSAVRGRR